MTSMALAATLVVVGVACWGAIFFGFPPSPFAFLSGLSLGGGLGLGFGPDFARARPQ